MSSINYEVYSAKKYDATRWGIWDNSIDDWYDANNLNLASSQDDIRSLEEKVDLMNINHNSLTDLSLFR